MFNIHSCCRLCLKQRHGVLVNCAEIDELSKAISTVIGLEILPTDNCSTKICRECTEKISNFTMFRNTVLSNQKSIEQYQFLQSKINFPVEIKEEDDDDVICVSQQSSEFPPVLEPMRPVNLQNNTSVLTACRPHFQKTSARKSTTKLPFSLPPKRRFKLKKVRVLCRRITEKDVKHVCLANRDKKILNVRGKPFSIDRHKPKITIIEKNSLTISEDKNITRTSITKDLDDKFARKITRKSESPSKKPAKERDDNKSPFYMKLNKLLESVVTKSLNQSSPPATSETPSKNSNSNRSGLFYINPVAASKSSNYRPIHSKQTSGPIEVSESNNMSNTSASAVSLNSTPVTTVSSSSVSGSLPVTNMQKLPIAPACNIRKLLTEPQKAIQCSEASTSHNVNANNVVYMAPKLSQVQGNYQTHFGVDNSATIPQQHFTIDRTTFHHRLPTTTILQRPAPTIKSEAIVSSSSQVMIASANRDEYIPLELLVPNTIVHRPGPEQIRNQPSQLKFVSQAETFIKNTISGSMIVNSQPNRATGFEAQPVNDHRVKVLSVNELNLRAAEANTVDQRTMPGRVTLSDFKTTDNNIIESRKLPIRITLVKIRNEVQIKLTDSKNNEIHFNNLTPQEQAAVKSSLLQPASKAQIVAAIRTCMPDKYSREMLNYLGIAVNDVIMK